MILNLATKPTVKQRVCRFPYGEKLRLPLEEFWLITEGIVKSYTFNEDGEIITPKEKLDKIGQPSLVLGLELLIFRSWQAKRATY